MADDILVVKENTRGNDLIIGDIHGNNETFLEVLESMETNDRLFLVGDLTDRGPNSIGVIREIIEFQKYNPNQLYVTRGNHEDLCLNCINGLESKKTALRLRALVEQVKSDVDKLDKTLSSDARGKEISRLIYTHVTNFLIKFADPNDKDLSERVKLHIKDGGEWLVTLYIQEIMEGKIIIDEKGENITYQDSEVKMVRDFMQKLPTIIHVNGTRPFNTVHANNPLSDKEIDEKIQSQRLNLTADAKRHALNARPNHKDASLNTENNTKRDADSDISYSGHSIVNANISTVREKTNTVDIDVATYKNNVSLVVNHTKGTCYFIGTGPVNAILLQERDKLNMHLQKQLAKNMAPLNTLNIVKNITKADVDTTKTILTTLTVPLATNATSSQHVASSQNQNNVSTATNQTEPQTKAPTITPKHS